MIQIKTITNCTLCLNYLLSTLLILGMVYICDKQMAKHKNNPVLMLMPRVWKHNIEVTWSQCYYVTGVNQAGLQQFSNFKPPIVLENPGIQFYISRALEKKNNELLKVLENTENSLNFCSHRK